MLGFNGCLDGSRNGNFKRCMDALVMKAPLSQTSAIIPERNKAAGIGILSLSLYHLEWQEHLIRSWASQPSEWRTKCHLPFWGCSQVLSCTELCLMTPAPHPPCYGEFVRITVVTLPSGLISWDSCLLLPSHCNHLHLHLCLPSLLGFRGFKGRSHSSCLLRSYCAPTWYKGSTYAFCLCVTQTHTHAHTS